jgi:hypothetical protein
MSSSPDITQSCSSGGDSPSRADPNHKPLPGRGAQDANSVDDLQGIGLETRVTPSKLGHRGSVELTKSEEDLFKEGLLY